MLTVSFICPFFFLSNQIFCYRFLIHLESGQVYCGTENQDDEIYFYHLFPFFLFSISHSNVIHREICVEDFSGTTAPRILQFGTNVGYDLLKLCKRISMLLPIIPLICQFFFLSRQSFLAFMRPRVFKFFIHIESGQVHCGTENKTEICVAFFLLFSISHSNLIHREICDKYFSRAIAHRIL